MGILGMVAMILVILAPEMTAAQASSDQGIQQHVIQAIDSSELKAVLDNAL